MAKIRIQCSECGHEARVPEQFRGKKVRCLRCHAKLRIPDDAPLAEPKRPKQKVPRRPAPRSASSQSRRESRATRGGPSSRTRRKALSYLRDLLQEYDHAIESISRGFEIDLRGEAFGVARKLVAEMLDCQSICDVKLAGGTGECCMVVSLQGHAFNPDDSFADDDDDTEIFQRASASNAGDWTPRGLVDSAVSMDDPPTNPAWQLEQDLPEDMPPESTMQSVFTRGDTSSQTPMEPVKAYERARQHIDEGEPAEAIKLLERAVRADKNFARAVMALGKAYASTGDYQRARRAFKHLTKIDGEDPKAQVLHAAAAVRCERLDEAKLSLATAIRLDPEYRQAYRYAAQLYERLGEPDMARKFRARYQALKLRG